MDNIIIQAGGKGTRLEKYTRNKPKCLVAVNNLPIIFYAFNKYPQANFQIICDYKSDVLEGYLKIFASKFKYTLVKTHEHGTSAGIKEALGNIPSGMPFLLMWSDLILADEWHAPDDCLHNYIGISKDFECRWSYVNGELMELPSRENGVAGLFIFKDKSIISDVPINGAFVKYLKNKKLKFTRLPLYGTKEVGTILSYNECDDTSNKSRPFNKMEFVGDIVIKSGITEQGRRLAIDEVAWYKKVRSLGYGHIPKIYQENPLRMERISGKNIFEYPDLLVEQKREILKKIIDALDKLHRLTEPVACQCDDVMSNYLEKTFNRIKDVKELIPFAKDEYIVVNGRKCKNVFFCYDQIKTEVEHFMPENFCFIHGDNTFSNLMFDSFNERIVLIDPRGYFGKTRYYGDEYYDWAKLYYSVIGNYDQFNRKNFTLNICNDEVKLKVGSNGWEDMESDFFDLLKGVDSKKIKFLHALIWISLTTYAWEDYDSICGAFYNGIYYLNEALEQ